LSFKKRFILHEIFRRRKKSFAITSVIFVILFVLFFYLGLTSLDPPPENGIAINFGTTEFGSGNVQPTEPIQSAPIATAAKQQQVIRISFAGY
jgi:hypothetical protein